jgi:hypothetical protein
MHARSISCARIFIPTRVTALTSDGKGPAALAPAHGQSTGRSRMTVLEALGGARDAYAVQAQRNSIYPHR